MLEMLISQLTDPFRIVLLVGLMVTQVRTRADTGTLLPLALGAVFVAVIAPMLNGPGGMPDAMSFGVGLAANVILLAIIYGARAIYLRIKGQG